MYSGKKTGSRWIRQVDDDYHLSTKMDMWPGEEPAVNENVRTRDCVD